MGGSALKGQVLGPDNLQVARQIPVVAAGILDDVLVAEPSPGASVTGRSHSVA